MWGHKNESRQETWIYITYFHRRRRSYFRSRRRLAETRDRLSETPYSQRRDSLVTRTRSELCCSFREISPLNCFQNLGLLIVIAHDIPELELVALTTVFDFRMRIRH